MCNDSDSFLQENVTALEVAQAQGHEEACRVLRDHLKSQQSLQTTKVSAEDTGKPLESQQSLETEEYSAGDTDKPTESHRQKVYYVFCWLDSVLN